MNLDSPDSQIRLYQVQLKWNQIAHERVKERLDRIVTMAAFRSGRRLPQDSAYEAYSEQASRSKHTTSCIPSRELEDAVFCLEDQYVQEALEIYCDETPEREITDSALLWLVYTQGLTQFIETRILHDVCFKLDQAQPSLGIDILRADGERFFSYRSERLKRDFPVVIRIVDRLKIEWQKKIAARSAQLVEGALPKNEESTQVEHTVTESVPLEILDQETDEAEEPPIFVHSENYDSITFNGQSYTLQERQAAVMKLLHEALKKGHPAVPGRKILSLPGCAEVSTVRDIFKSRPQLWGALIVSCEDIGEGRGFYRLSPSIKA
jgi:hypothetical protein